MDGLVNYPDSSDSENENNNDISASESPPIILQNQKEKSVDSEKFQETDKNLNSYVRPQADRLFQSSPSNQAQTFHDETQEDCNDNGSDPSSHELEPKLKRRKECDGNSTTKPALILPQSIQSMFTRRKGREWKDNPSQHGNRMRSFPHVEGNWATHVFIPVKQDERLLQFVCSLLNLLQPLSFTIMEDFHVSLSRTVVVRHHWIDSLVDSLRQAFSAKTSCVGDLEDIKLFTNDEKTRTFLCVEVSQDDTLFTEYVTAVDKCFEGFKLQKYYKKPSFHISIAWCLGDVTNHVSNQTLMKAKDLLMSFCQDNPELSVVFAQHICCRSGNKSFFIPLIV